MSSSFLLYGANGFVGNVVARVAARAGLRPILAGRNAGAIGALADELGLESRVGSLSDPAWLERAMNDVSAVLHCAGPFVSTYRPMVDACLRTGTHYLDLTGEIPVLEAIAREDAAARARGIMLLPAAGFDVVPTDCLALHLKQRLPSATHLAIGFRVRGPAGLPPGTQRTAIELTRFGNRIRRNGELIDPGKAVRTREIDFGDGPVLATGLTWGDVFTAYYTTAIPNIENFVAVSERAAAGLALMNRLRPLLRLAPVRRWLQGRVRPGPTEHERSLTRTDVWAEVTDSKGNRASARLHGPEAGVDWTVDAALVILRKVLAGDAPVGFQTPALAYGADLVLECQGVTREDLEPSPSSRHQPLTP